MEERTALYLLNTSRELWTRTIEAMRAYAGSYAAALELSSGEYRRAGILKTQKKMDALTRVRQNEEQLLREMEEYEKSGIRIVTLLDSGYPRRLRNIPDAPPVLYVRGQLPPEDRPSVSIVGSRSCSQYGRTVTKFFAGELAAAGISVISGLASGIDATAGEAAVRAGGRSYAVLGTGVNICYPRESYPLYRELTEGAGGVLSELDPKAEALPQHFVMRNRIIAGLGDVLLVIEAREKSGTSITVGYALDQGKDIFALPGRITDPLGYGCNRLLKEGAFPLTSPADVLEYFGMEENGQLQLDLKKPKDLSEEEERLLDCMADDPQHMEDLADAAGMTLKRTLILCGSLERKGYAKNTGGAYYCRCLQ